MKTVTLKKHSAIPGAWVASLGRRRVSIVQPTAQAALGLVPSFGSVLEAFSATSRPGDRAIDPESCRLVHQL